MSLEGLRAWIGEVERRLRMRTRVFLALAVVAIGLGGAAIYLAIDANDSSVSEADVRALQEKLEARIDEGATTPSAEAEPEPAPQPEEPKPKSNGGKKNGGGTSGGASSGSTGATPEGAPGGAANSAKIRELLERAKKRSEANE